MSAPTQHKTLLLFDFDQTILPSDTDREVFIQLGRPELNKEAVRAVREEGRQWTELMDELLVRAQKETNSSASEVVEAMGRVQFDSNMELTLRELAAHQLVDMLILSDANDAYIKAVLDAREPSLTPCFKDIITNRSYVENGLLRIAKRRTNTDSSFGKKHERCNWGCSYNLCKGEEVERLVYGIEPASRPKHLSEPELASRTRNYSRVIYIGDGSNDFCPSTRLHSSYGDVVFCRKGYTLEKRIAKQMAEKAPGISTRIEVWDTYEELAELFRKEIPGLGGNAGSGGRL
jgi:pyridoxal phosphate phosphatase PHOSPHO2